MEIGVNLSRLGEEGRTVPKRLMVFVVALLALGLMVPSQTLAAKKKVLTAVTYVNPRTMDPHVARSFSTLIAPIQVYDKMVDLRGGTQEIEPRLATSWKMEQGGKAWLFNLRKGVKFHDGREFKADAVKFSFDRLMAIGKAPAGLFKGLEKVEVVNDHAVRFHLDSTIGPWLHIMANIKGGYIVNPNVMKHEKKKGGKGDFAQAWMSQNGAGTGPYKLVRWDKGQQLIYERNKDYWDKSVDPDKAFDRVVLKIIREDVNQRLALTSGKADLLVRSMSPLEFDKAKESPIVNTMVKKSTLVNMIEFNLGVSPTNNKKFRMAVAHAFDYDGYIKHVQRGYASRVRGIVPSMMPGRDPNAALPSRDLPKARQLLKESGVDLSKVDLELNYTKGPKWVRQTIELLQSNLKEIGVKSHTSSSSYVSMIGKWQKAATRGSLYTRYDSPSLLDPYALVDKVYRSGKLWNLSGYKSDEVDRLLEIGRTSMDNNARMEAYKKAHRIISDEYPAIYTHQGPGLFAHNKKLKNVIYNPGRFQGWYFREMHWEGATN